MPKTIPTLFSIKDDMNPVHFLWFAIQRNAYGVSINVYKEKSEHDDFFDDEEAMLVVGVDFFNNRLKTLIYDNKTRVSGRDDPYEKVYVEDVTGWTCTISED